MLATTLHCVKYFRLIPFGLDRVYNSDLQYSLIIKHVASSGVYPRLSRDFKLLFFYNNRLVI